MRSFNVETGPIIPLKLVSNFWRTHFDFFRAQIYERPFVLMHSCHPESPILGSAGEIYSRHWTSHGSTPPDQISLRGPLLPHLSNHVSMGPKCWSSRIRTGASGASLCSWHRSSAVTCFPGNCDADFNWFKNWLNFLRFCITQNVSEMNHLQKWQNLFCGREVIEPQVFSWRRNDSYSSVKLFQSFSCKLQTEGHCVTTQVLVQIQKTQPIRTLLHSAGRNNATLVHQNRRGIFSMLLHCRCVRCVCHCWSKPRNPRCPSPHKDSNKKGEGPSQKYLFAQNSTGRDSTSDSFILVLDP